MLFCILGESGSLGGHFGKDDAENLLVEEGHDFRDSFDSIDLAINILDFEKTKTDFEKGFPVFSTGYFPMTVKRLENTVNKLFFDTTLGLIGDPTGQGLADILGTSSPFSTGTGQSSHEEYAPHQYVPMVRIPVLDASGLTLEDEWASWDQASWVRDQRPDGSTHANDRLWRYFKLLAKGYNEAVPGQTVWVVNRIMALQRSSEQDFSAGQPNGYLDVNVFLCWKIAGGWWQRVGEEESCVLPWARELLKVSESPAIADLQRQQLERRCVETAKSLFSVVSALWSTFHKAEGGHDWMLEHCDFMWKEAVIVYKQCSGEGVLRRKGGGNPVLVVAAGEAKKVENSSAPFEAPDIFRFLCSASSEESLSERYLHFLKTLPHTDRYTGRGVVQISDEEWSTFVAQDLQMVGGEQEEGNHVGRQNLRGAVDKLCAVAINGEGGAEADGGTRRTMREILTDPALKNEISILLQWIIRIESKLRTATYNDPDWASLGAKSVSFRHLYLNPDIAPTFSEAMALANAGSHIPLDQEFAQTVALLERELDGLIKIEREFVYPRDEYAVTALRVYSLKQQEGGRTLRLFECAQYSFMRTAVVLAMLEGKDFKDSDRERLQEDHASGGTGVVAEDERRAPWHVPSFPAKLLPIPKDRWKSSVAKLAAGKKWSVFRANFVALVKEYYDQMSTFKLAPASPLISNAGLHLAQGGRNLATCFTQGNSQNPAETMGRLQELNFGSHGIQLYGTEDIVGLSKAVEHILEVLFKQGIIGECSCGVQDSRRLGFVFRIYGRPRSFLQHDNLIIC